MRGLFVGERNGGAMSNDMVRDVRHEGTGDSARTVIELRNGNCLAVSRELVRFARDARALDDALGNGVYGVIEIAPSLAPRWETGSGFLQEQAGGAVLLHGGTTLLVKPHSIELYAAPLDALHARDCRGRIDLAAG